MEQNKYENRPGNPTWADATLPTQLDFSEVGLQILSKQDWRHWITRGYVIVKQAVTADQADRTADLLWEFEEKSPTDPATWYGNSNSKNEMQMVELKGTGMVEIYNHQYLWDNRQSLRVYSTFADLWQRHDLWVSIDRANLNMPLLSHQTWGGFIHWDADTAAVPRPSNVQGVLALNDQTDPDMGGFQCIPDLFEQFEEWVLTQPEGRNPYKPDTSGFEIVKVPLEKGDLLVWNSMLAHGIRPNNSDKVRIAQYISMNPAQPDNSALINIRLDSWKNKTIPEGYAFPGDPRQVEKRTHAVAELSPLGKQLLGATPWPILP